MQRNMDSQTRGARIARLHQQGERLHIKEIAVKRLTVIRLKVQGVYLGRASSSCDSMSAASGTMAIN